MVMTTTHLDAGLKQTLERLSVAQRILAMEGHNDLTLGHMSVRDPQGRGLWLKKNRRGLDEIFGSDDYLLIDFDGTEIEQQGNRHSEWPIHAEIMKARPDVMAVGHTHARYAVLFSAAEEELCAFNHEGANLLGNHARYRETAGLINTVALGRSLASCLGATAVALMKNHGITFVGRSVEEATMYGIFMERACRSQIEMAATGWKYETPSEAGYDRTMSGGVAGTNYSAQFFDYFARTLARAEAHRALR